MMSDMNTGALDPLDRIETTWVEERVASRVHIYWSVRQVVEYVRERLTDEANSSAMRAERHKLIRGVLAAQRRYRREAQEMRL